MQVYEVGSIWGSVFRDIGLWGFPECRSPVLISWCSFMGASPSVGLLVHISWVHISLVNLWVLVYECSFHGARLQDIGLLMQIS